MQLMSLEILKTKKILKLVMYKICKSMFIVLIFLYIIYVEGNYPHNLYDPVLITVAALWLLIKWFVSFYTHVFYAVLERDKIS